MRILFYWLLLWAFPSIAQTDSEIFLFDLQKNNENYTLSHPRNISNSKGYDNQPSFYDNHTIIFAATRKGQTDIAQYNTKDGTKQWITDTPESSEFSPLKIPKKKEIATVRLYKDGKQLLYRYNLKNKTFKVLAEDLVIGYYTWYDKNRIVSFVLDSTPILVASDLKKKRNNTLDKNIGRSIHRIPNTTRVSYISKAGRSWKIKAIDLASGAIEDMIPTLPDTEDLCWLPDGTILMAKGNSLYKYNPQNDKDWILVKTFTDKKIYKITRLATNSNGNLLALVAEASPEIIVQQQLDAYNKRDINAFLATYSDTVKIYNFPNTFLYEGKETMLASYGPFFKATPDLHCEIKSRTVIGNKVIDEEYVTANGSTFTAVAIYEVENNTIVKVTFIR